MTMFTAKDRQTIWEVIDHLISHRRKITVQTEGDKSSYTSRIIKASYMAGYSRHGNGPHLILGELIPEEGYRRIKPGRRLVLNFISGNTSYEFTTLCFASLRDGTDSRIIVSFPESMVLPERRRGRRGSSEMPELISAVLTTKKGFKTEKNYDLPIVDYSTNGVGVFVSEEDSDLIESAQKGDRLKNIILFSFEAMIKVDGTVRHKSKRKRRGRQGADSFVLGIEFDEALMDFSALQ
jgi:hypothetical protein